MTARHHASTAPPPLRRVLVLVLAVAAILLCGTGISLAEPTTPPAPAAPTAPAPTSPTSGVPAPAVPQQHPVEPVESDSTVDESECGVTNIPACVAGAIDGFFRRLIESGLDPVMEWVAEHLLTTPEPSTFPRVQELWDSSWQLVLAMYGLVVIAAGVLLMLHETLQTRWGWRELLPRLVVGFIAGAMSMFIATRAIRFANGLAVAMAGDGVESGSTTEAFKSMMNVGGGTGTNLFATLLLVVFLVVMTILLITWVIRLVITVVLIVAAPLAMMCFALPGLDAIARWWWRAFAACLAIQVVQSMVLIVGLRVFLSPDGWWFFGPTRDGVVNIIVADAMGLLLIKIPFWLLAALKIGNGRGMVSSLVRGFVMYKTFGLLRSAEKAVFSRSGGGKKPVDTGASDPDPYAKARATRDGQLMLPLPGLRRVPRKPAPTTRIPDTSSMPVASPQGEQLMLPLPQFHGGVDLGPKPHLRRDGQYQLPITVERVPKPAAPPPVPVPKPLPGTSRPRPKQLAFDFTPPAEPDPYAGLRPTRSGQYPLPLEVRRTPAPPRTSTPPPAAPSAPPASRPSAGRQLHLPLPDLPVRRRTRRSPGKGPK
ncbi:hypothetical protein [Nocardia otitidiscaviarum]|uniref:hypothetical protein n=1 Tax=Nocardia otitidiscaviarum TaxID=1823 RepID=UPI00189332F5|nr:hypothetical protein [Nocardia otitidiscaviarum]MBF6183366.1 hypothetical protein [Nocardia otitidiscaviarum]